MAKQKLAIILMEVATKVQLSNSPKISISGNPELSMNNATMLVNKETLVSKWKCLFIDLLNTLRMITKYFLEIK